MALSICAGCGGPMVRHRTDRQQVGEREIRIVWRICTACRCVSLADWEYLQSGEPVSPPKRRPGLKKEDRRAAPTEAPARDFHRNAVSVSGRGWFVD
jgi:hypothetical protein